MAEFYPLIIVGATIGVLSLCFVVAHFYISSRKTAKEYDRKMSDLQIIRRLLGYARPYIKEFILALVLMIISIVYDLLSPVLVGEIEEMVKDRFELSALFSRVAVYAGILVVSMVSMYLQTMILQKVGQKILTALRKDVFSHIESLSHQQLNNIPVGKHTELYETCPSYRKMVDLQKLEEEGGAHNG